jgi:hypothetical protein
MATTYSARAYSAYGQLLGYLRPLSVEAGAVVDGVGEASVTVAAGGLTAWWKDIAYLDLWRYGGGGRIGRWGCYMVRGWTEKAEGHKRTWQFKGKSLTHLLSGRPGMQGTTASNATTRELAERAVLFGLGVWPTALPITLASVDGPSQRLTAKQTNQATLAALKGLADAARGFPLPEPFHFDLLPVISSDGSLSLTLATWTGEYGQDRRVGSGARPVMVWPNAAGGWEATEDRASLTTVAELGGGYGRIAGPALDNPYGEYWGTYKSSTADSYAQDVTDALSAVQAGRPVTRLPLSLAADLDILDLALGDVVSVAYGGAWVDGRMNVLHVGWNEQGESVSARVDVEVA